MNKQSSRNFICLLILCFFICISQAIAQPTISSLSTTSGNRGASVTISGSNFNTTAANNVVYFGATKASVSSASSTSLSVSVPTDATFKPVSVLNTGTHLAAFSNKFFLPTFDNSAYLSGMTNFNTKVDFGTGSNPTGMVIADMDGDGKADMVVVNENSNTVSILRNISTTGTITSSSFATKVDFATDTSPVRVAIADFDMDGKPDMAVINKRNNTVSVFRNISTSGSITTSSFDAKVDFTTGSQPDGIAVGDFDKDGKPDLAIVNFGANTVSVLRNTSSLDTITTGSFASKVDFTTGSNPTSVAVADIDGDGKLEILATNAASGTMSVFRNTASSGSITTSSFASKVDFTTGNYPDNIAVGDLDGDGKLDLAVACFTGTVISVFRNTASSGSIGSSSLASKVDFSTSSTPWVEISDADGDGKPDLIVANDGSNSVSVFLNTSSSGSISSSSFASAVNFTTGNSPHSVAMGDLDGDGKPDLAAVNNTDFTISVLHNNPLSTIGNVTTLCVGATRTLTDSATRGSWSSSAASIASINSSGVVTAVGVGTAIITYTVPGGNTTASIAINARPTASITSSAATICTGTPLTLAGSVTGTGTLISYNWSGPNSYSTSGTSGTSVFTPSTTAQSGVYSLTVTYPGVGCTSSVAVTSPSVTVNVKPTVASITPSVTTLCTGNPITFTAGAVTGTGTLTSYNWTGPNSFSTTGTATTAVFTPSAAASSGVYSLTVTYPGTGCTSNGVITSSITVKTSPTVASITPSTTTICTGTALTLTAGAVTGTGSLTSYNWTGPNSYSTSGTATTAVFSPTTTAASGSYSLTVTYNNGCTSAMVITSPSVTVNARPTIAGITPSATTVCVGNALTLTAGTVTGTGTLTSYNWSGPNSYSSTGTATTAVLTPTTTAAGGVYSVTVTYPGTGCTSATSITSPSVTVNAKPTIASITPSTTTICTGTALTLTAGAITGTGTFSSYNWSGPNSYSTTGTATTAVLTPTTTAAGGVYSLTVTYPGSGCTSTTVVTSPSVTVNAQPTIAGITPSTTTICTGTALTLTAGAKTGTGTFTSYNWAGPNGYSTSGTATTAILTPTTSAAGGVYSLTVTYPGTGCTSNAAVTSPSVTVNVKPAIASITTTDSIFCLGSSMTFTAGGVSGTGTLASYNWSGPNSYSATGTTNTTVLTPATTAASGNYSVTVTYAGTGCTSAPVMSSSVTVNNLPTISGSLSTSSSNLCTGTALTLFLGGGGVVNFHGGSPKSYNWSGPNSYSTTTSSFSLSETFTPTTTAASGTYTMTVSNWGTGCTSNSFASSSYVTVNALPTIASITPSATTICTGTALTLAAGAATGTGTLTSYNWSGPNSYSTTGTASTAVLTPTTTAAGGVYSVTVTYPGTGCTSTTSVTSPSVTVNAKPTIASITPSTTTICTGTALTLTAGAITGTGALSSYNWSGPNSYSTTGTATTAVLTPTTTAAGGVYSLTVTYPGSGCTSTAVVTSPSVSVNAKPTIAGITPSTTTICTGTALTLTAGAKTGTGTFTSYNWAGPNGYSTSGTATTAVLTPTTTAAGGAYSLTVTYPGTGCTSTAAVTSPSVTVNAKPTIANITPSLTTVCTGNALTLTAGTKTGSGTFTSYNWTGPNGYSTTGTATTAVLTPTTTAAGGVYSLTVTYAGTGCTSTTAVTSPSVTVNPSPVAGTITGATVICTGSTATFTDTTSGGVWSSMNTSVATVSGSVVTGVSPGSATISYTVTNSCGSIAATTIVSVGASQWVGGASGHERDWNTSANWACGGVPTVTADVFIPSGTIYAPVIASSTNGNTRNITIDAGTSVTLNSGAFLNVKGDVANNGSVTGAGTVKLNGTSAQQISGAGTVNNLELSNASGATIQTGAKLTIDSLLTVTSGTLATGDSLVLSSDSVITARVAAIPSTGAAITGNVKVMQYVQGGYRRFRFWSHPFNGYISLSQLENYIDVTGAGGATNGFTTTATNAPSAFRYDPYTGNSSLSYDPGWKPFTTAYGTADTNRLNQYEGIRLFVRGAKGEGLGYGTYTPSPVTIGMWGTLNQGNQTVHLSKGTSANQDYNMVGNPYPSPVDIGTVLFNAKVSGNITGSAFYVWNPSLGAAGQFQAIFIGTASATPYYLPAYCSFQLRAAHNGDTLNFTENNKGASSTANLFRAQPDFISLAIYDTNYHPWDMLHVQFNEAATDGEDDKYDATKLQGAGFNFYTLSADNQKLAIDARPYAAGKTIPLGIGSSYAQEFIIKAEGMAMPAGGRVYLHDKLLQQYILLVQGTEYRFSVTDSKETQGNNRFELSMEPIMVNTAATNKGFEVTIYPNPATDEVNVSFTAGNNTSAHINILDVSGVSVYSEELGIQQSGTHKIKTNGLAAGIYMVEVTCGADKVIKKLIKE